MYFSGDSGYQNYLVVSPMFHSLILHINKIVSWQPTGVSSQWIQPTNSSLTPTIVVFHFLQ